MFVLEKLFGPAISIVKTIDEMVTSASIQNAADAKAETARRLSAYAALADLSPTEDRTFPNSA